MNKIEAIIRHQKLEEVHQALEGIGLGGFTVTDVRGMGRQGGVTHTYRGSQYTINLQARVKIEIVVPDEMTDEAVTAIAQAANTGEVGDGKIFVSPVSDAVRIRTNERGDVAIS